MRRDETQQGAALVIALGFLAALMIMALGFAARARSDRLAGRDHLENARARQLLSVALSRAMTSIEGAGGEKARATASHGAGQPISSDLDFRVERAYLPLGAPDLREAFETALAAATWDAVEVDGTQVGRVAFVALDISGLLDANAVGGLDGSGALIARGPGLSPKEIQLSPELLPELHTSAALVESDGALSPTDDPALAFVRNRDLAWRGFDTARDVKTLNNGPRGGAIFGDLASFNTFSHSPPAWDDRVFMGTNSATLAEAVIAAELARLEHVNAEFVMNQLRDYLDRDSLPQNAEGEYTDLSVEAVPLINEAVLTCDLRFSPVLEPVNLDDGTLGFEVVSVVVSNSFRFELEVWHPFAETENAESYRVRLADSPALDETLFGPAEAWRRDVAVPAEAVADRARPKMIELHRGATLREVSSPTALQALLADTKEPITLPLVQCLNAEGELVDRVANLRLPWPNAVEKKLSPLLTPLAEALFDPQRTEDRSVQFVVGTACVDPRLNWNGENMNQWKDEMDAVENDDADGASPNAVNAKQIAPIDTPDPTDLMYVRDADRIDSPWEFTYFLHDPTRPWRTFQPLEAHDDFNTRFILKGLSPHPNGPPPAGRVQPRGGRTNAVASVFLSASMSPFAGTTTPRRMNAATAKRSAELWIKHVATHPTWPADATEGFDLPALAELLGDEAPWTLESFFRNSIELFDSRGEAFAILIAAEVGADWDRDGLESDEIRASRQAIAYVWRDAPSGKAAITFYGLTDTLRSSIGAGQSWGDLLEAFNPN